MSDKVRTAVQKIWDFKKKTYENISTHGKLAQVKYRHFVVYMWECLYINAAYK